MSESRGKILIVDDDPVFSKVLGQELSKMGFEVTQGYDTDIMSTIESVRIDVVILDIVMPGFSGLELLKQIKDAHPSLDVIMLTGNATIENAVTSMKDGAFDYFTKPVELDRVEQVLRRCFEARQLKTRNKILKNKLSDLREGKFVGKARAVQDVKALVSRFADSDSTVLIYGESGTGKELLANLIHRNSSRFEEPFIIVDCTALNETLLESELFGHERGAFTDAVAKKYGIFEVADGGTVFLDEVGDIPPSLQAKLLRVVETKGFRRVGGNERIQVDVRLITATNKDLLDLVQKGEFREDLYYRLNVISLTMPPLREYKEDIPLLVNHFLGVFCESHGKTREFSPDAIHALQEHDWPGNVRELRNFVERCVLLSNTKVINAVDLPLKTSPVRTILAGYRDKELPSLHDMDNEYIHWILIKTNGNKQLAAKILKIDRKTLSRRLNQESDGE
ncbi:MAG: sigma-54 dependent transcriptional regulator [candidate division Zixibacteria bacterium]